MLTPVVSLFTTVPAATSSHCICLLVEGSGSYRLHQQLAFVQTASLLLPSPAATGSSLLILAPCKRCFLQQ